MAWQSDSKGNFTRKSDRNIKNARNVLECPPILYVII